MAKKIKFQLDEKSIDKAIDEIAKYRREFGEKTKKLLDRIAAEIEEEALINFSSALCEDIVNGDMRSPDVKISVEFSENMTIVIARGNDAVFCEFGAGVYHNGSAGSSPHPKGQELGLTIGSYGQGKGSRKVWGYYDESGQLILTRGTPASMPMYNAMQTVCGRISTIAKEVFS